MSKTMTLLATVFEKCTGSHLCDPIKHDMSPTEQTEQTESISDALRISLMTTIAENETRIAELIDRANDMELRRIDMAAEIERNGLIEAAYHEIEKEYKLLVEEADAITARNIRISKSLSLARVDELLVKTRHGVAMDELRDQISELTKKINYLEELITRKRDRIKELNTELNTYKADPRMIEEKNTPIETHDELNVLATQLHDMTTLAEERNVTIAEYTTRFNELKAEYEELANKYYVLTHTHHSSTNVEIVVPGLTYKPEIGEYVRLYGLPENFEFDDVKLDAIRWDMYGEGDGVDGGY